MNGDAAALFVRDVSNLPLRMKDEVTRPAVVGRRELRRASGVQFARPAIEGKLEDRVWTRVRHEGEAIARIKQDRVRLLRRGDTLHRLLAERALGSDGMHGHLRRDVVGAE